MALCCNDLLILVTQAAVLVLMYAVRARWLSLTLSGCSEYALWATVVAGTHTGLLQLDLTLQGLTRTFMPRLYPYRATSAAQPVLDCFQVKNSFAEDGTAFSHFPNHFAPCIQYALITNSSHGNHYKQQQQQQQQRQQLIIIIIIFYIIVTNIVFSYLLLLQQQQHIIAVRVSITINIIYYHYYS